MASDHELGKEIHKHLVNVGIETPMIRQYEFDTHQKKKKIEEHFREIMKVLDLDLTDDSLEETPNRVAKMYVDELFRGLDYSHFPKCTVIDNKMASELVVVKGVNVSSSCEHHFVTIDGTATVAYIPDGKVLGLSKINRIVQFFSQRPQVQERLTNQIWHSLNYILGTENIAVYIDAVHYCVKSRGVRDQSSQTVTNKLGGEFMSDHALRSEFMSIARG